VEAAEGLDFAALVVGVQWHPERLAPEDHWVYSVFVDACRNRP
jgi:gamma-glutamyl-gamma-aminobutyrate hydrolase PuuD